MGGDTLAWCNTCGKDITLEQYEKEGDCQYCADWWMENYPPFGGPYEKVDFPLDFKRK